MISVEHVSKNFGDRPAVQNVSFMARNGETLGLLGPNGAGKTTCMRIITGYLPPSDGAVTIDGLDVFEHPFEVKQKIGYMPEQPPLYLDMTARECLTFVAELHGLRGSAIDRAIERAAGQCGIAHVLDRLTGNLSKGYRQRVGLAQALVHDPEVLVLDEPTAGLDPVQIIEVRNLIRILGEHRTVLVSSHILSEVTNLCKRVVVINRGRLVANDSIEALSSKLGKGRNVRIRVLRPGDLALGVITALPGVAGASRSVDGTVSVTVASDDVLDALSSAVVRMGAGLVELREEGMTLEDIFLKIVAGEEAQ